MAQIWAESRSKDPRKKVGAVIYCKKTGAMCFGYNGFPSGIPDDEKIWNNKHDHTLLTKYDLVIHAEQNAVNKAVHTSIDLTQSMLVCTHIPCPSCIKNVILAHKIPEVYYASNIINSLSDRDKKVISYLVKNITFTHMGSQ